MYVSIAMHIAHGLLLYCECLLHSGSSQFSCPGCLPGYLISWIMYTISIITINGRDKIVPFGTQDTYLAPICLSERSGSFKGANRKFEELRFVFPVL